MSHKDFNNVLLMREPKENSGLLLKKLKEIIGEKYDVTFENYWQFHKWSVENLTEFWTEIWDFIGIICSKKYDKVIDMAKPMWESPEWFCGARLNFAENLLKFRDDRIALISAGEDRETEKISFIQMYEETELYAAALRKQGVKKGDIVACYMSNRKEPLFAMQATTSMGAIWTGALPLLGPQAVINRFKQVRPKILFTLDRFQNDGQEIELLERVSEIVNGLSSIERVIIVPTTVKSKNKDISKIRNSCFLDDFLSAGRNEDGSVPAMLFEQVSFSHPVFVSFTSGTTGAPKAMMHGCGVLMPTAKDFWLQLEGSRNDIWFSTSPVGWVSWSAVSILSFTGLCIFLYEGAPYCKSPTYLWDLIDKYNITNLFMPASALDNMDKLSYHPNQNNHLSSLKTCIAGGSIVKSKVYEFVYGKVKKDILFSSQYGCTELVGSLLTMDPTLNIYKGELAVPCLGLDIRCVDNSGKIVQGEYGELIISSPYPSLPLGLWGDTDGMIYKNTYYSKYSGKFSIGDFAVINPITKGYVICGRSDETLKQRGARFGSSEIYNIVAMFPEIQDSLCVSQNSRQMDERAVLFLKMTGGHSVTDELIKRLRATIAAELTQDHIPDVILEVEDIPYSVNGKKMEIIVKNIINKRPFNTENIINPSCLKQYFAIPEIMQF